MNLKKKLITGLVSILLILGVINIDDIRYIINHDFLKGLLDQGPEYEVVRVVDGDTIIIDMEGKNERVRLIGLDTPESVHPDAKRNTESGEIASEFTEDKLEGKSVTLEYDVQEKDRYGRILAYVYVDDEMFNRVLLKEGYAKAVTYPPNVKYTDEFRELEEEARESKKGLWEHQEL